MGVPERVTFGYEIGVEFESKHRYSFDITDAVQSWVSDATAKSKGIIFKATNALESGSAYTYRTIASYNRSSNKPTLSVTFNYASDGITSVTGKDNVNEGSLLQLTANGMEGTITWTSSDTNIATVDSTGKVTGIHAGQVTITARAEGYMLESITLYVTFPDGVYYLTRGPYYLSVQNSGISNFTKVQLEYPRSDAIEKLAQKWRIKYLGNGYYSVRPMHKPDMGLDVTGNNVDLFKIGSTDNVSIPEYARWRIIYHYSSYAFLNYDSNTDTILGMHPLDDSLDSGERVRAEPYNLADTMFGWTISPTTVSTQAMIYKDGEHNDGVRMGIMPNQTRTLDDMGIVSAFVCSNKISQTVDRWYSSDISIATVDEVTGAVTGVSRGTTAITAQYSLTGTTYLASFTVVVSDVPISGWELEYEPEKWNDFPVLRGTNCYAYALNGQVWPGTQRLMYLRPGESVNNMIEQSNISKDTIVQYILLDAEEFGFVFDECQYDSICPDGAYKVALVVDPATDFHWYRQNKDGTWSHKPGPGNVTNRDASNQIIYDPYTANRNYSSVNYTEFVGYYIITPLNYMYSPVSRQTAYAMDTLEHIVFDLEKQNLPNSIQAQKVCEGMTYTQVCELIGTPQYQKTFGLLIVAYEVSDGSVLYVEYVQTDGNYVVHSCQIEGGNQNG